MATDPNAAVYDALRKADAAGDADAVARLAAYLKQGGTDAVADEPDYNDGPTFAKEVQRRFDARQSAAEIEQFARDHGRPNLQGLSEAIDYREKGGRGTPAVIAPNGAVHVIRGALGNIIGPQLSRATADVAGAIGGEGGTVGRNIAADQDRETFAADHPYISTALNVAGAVPVALAKGGAALLGGVTGAMQSEAHDAGGIALDAGVGAVGGAVGDRIVRGAAHLLAPVASRALSTLTAAGVPVTPGQAVRTVGSRFTDMLSSLEDKATSLPIVGDMITADRRAAQEGFTRGAAQRALTPVGETLPATESGNEAVAFTRRAMTRAYNRALGGMQMVPDEGLAADLADVGRRATDGTLNRDSANQLRATAQSIIGHRIPAMRPVTPEPFAPSPRGNLPVPVSGRAAGNPLVTQGVSTDVGPYIGPQASGSTQYPPVARYMDGETLKSVDSELRKRAAAAQQRDPALATALYDMRNAVRNAAARSSSPEANDALRAADEGYANYVRVRRAAAGAVDGNFSPNQLRTAVRASDTSTGKGATAAGEALMQDYASAGQQVLPSRTGDTGTGGRTAVYNPIAWALGTAGAPLYASARALTPLLTRQAGAQAQAAANLLRASAAPVGAIAGQYLGPPVAAGALLAGETATAPARGAYHYLGGH